MTRMVWLALAAAAAIAGGCSTSASRGGSGGGGGSTVASGSGAAGPGSGGAGASGTTRGMGGTTSGMGGTTSGMGGAGGTGSGGGAALSISLDVIAGGNVASMPAGLSCDGIPRSVQPVTCTHDFAAGTVVLTGKPDATFGYSKVTYTGCDSAAGLTCTVAGSGAKKITATFSG